MAKAKPHGIILVIDDHYGEESSDFYSRSDFDRDFGDLPFGFAFSSAWDAEKGYYSVEAALRAVDTYAPDGVLLDVVFDRRALGGHLGLAVLRELTTRWPMLPVVIMTVLRRDEAWEKCARLGAVDYLPKPMDARRLWQTLDRYVGVTPEYWLLGQAAGFLEAVLSAAQASEGGRTDVMISGDTGTGKELLARYIGRHGARAHQPFVPIHIAPMQPEQQQAELFGARRGSYTGATQDRKGYFEVADKGVAFLDEIGEIDARTQVNLLRVAESGEIAPLGEAMPRQVDVQIVSATNANLALMVKDGEFRQDLWERLRGSAIHLPSLYQRVEDIPLLTRHLLRVEALARRIPLPVLSEAMEQRLMTQRWSGNVRALAKYVGRVFDVAGRSCTPTDNHFLSELILTNEDLPRSISENQCKDQMVSLDIKHSLDFKTRLQNLRLDELGLLYQAAIDTSHKVTGTLDRATAAALLKGKRKCSTNEFDRWLVSLWNSLDQNHRNLACQRYPELIALVERNIGKRETLRTEKAC